MLGFIFVKALTAIGLFGGWLYPFIGLMIYYAFAILRPTALWHWAPWPFHNHSALVGASTLAGWALNGFGRWDHLRYIRIPLLGFCLFLLAGSVATVQFAIDRALAWHHLELQLKIGIMMLVMLTLVTSPRNLQIFAWIIVGCLGYLAYNLNYQYVQNPGFAWGLYWRGFGGVDNNGLAMIMLAGVPMAFFMAVWTRYLWAKALCGIAALLMIHVILFSYSRGGMLGLILTGIALTTFSLIWLPRKFLTILALCVVVVLSLEMAGDEVRDHFSTIFVDEEERDESAASRFDTWAGGWEAMKDNPLGLGPRNFNRVSHEYGLTWNKSVHNLFLQVGADYGFAGAFGLMVFYIGSALQSYLMSRSRVARRLVWPVYFGQGVTMSLAGFLVCSIFIGMEAVEIGYMVAMLGLGTVAYVRKVEALEPPPETIPPEMEQVPSPEEMDEIELDLQR